MEGFFTLKNLPLPPSSNHQYWYQIMNTRGGKPCARPTPTSELKKFQNTMLEWKKVTENNIALHKCRAKIREGLLKGLQLDIRTFACFPYFDLFTKEGGVRRMDGTNRIKALHDCLAEMLEVDDAWFWNATVRKVETKRPEPYCIVLVGLTDHLTVDQLKERGMI